MPVDLAELERLEKASTAAPWLNGCVIGAVNDDADERKIWSGALVIGSFVTPWSSLHREGANARCAVAARNALPELIAEVKRLRGFEECFKMITTALEGSIEAGKELEGGEALEKYTKAELTDAYLRVYVRQRDEVKRLRLVWSSETPKVEGWYYWRKSKLYDPYVLKVLENEGSFRTYPILKEGGEFAGPIPTPEEPT